MDWSTIGAGIRSQREYMGYTREMFAEIIGITPEFCSDIDTGISSETERKHAEQLIKVFFVALNSTKNESTTF